MAEGEAGVGVESETGGKESEDSEERREEKRRERQKERGKVLSIYQTAIFHYNPSSSLLPTPPPSTGCKPPSILSLSLVLRLTAEYT